MKSRQTYAEVYTQLVNELLRVQALFLGSFLDFETMLIRSRHDVDWSVGIRESSVPRVDIRNDEAVQMADMGYCKVIR